MPVQLIEVWIAVRRHRAVLQRLVDGLQHGLCTGRRTLTNSGRQIGARITGVIVLRQSKEIHCLGTVSEVPGLSCLSQHVIRSSCCAGLAGLRKAAEKEKSVSNNGTANAPAKIIQFDRILFLGIAWIQRRLRIVRPAISIQRGIAEVVENSSVKAVGATPGDEIDLHVGLSVALIQIKLLGLDRHFLHVFQSRLYRGRGISAEFHSARAANYAIDIVALCDGRQPIPRARVSSDQLR